MQQQATITESTFMHDANLRPTRKPRRRPTHKMLVSFSAAYFAGALITDLVYWQMPDELWERFSIWLITAGLIMAGPSPSPYACRPAGRQRIHKPPSRRRGRVSAADL